MFASKQNAYVFPDKTGVRDVEKIKIHPTYSEEVRTDMFTKVIILSVQKREFLYHQAYIQ